MPEGINEGLDTGIQTDETTFDWAIREEARLRKTHAEETAKVGDIYSLAAKKGFRASAVEAHLKKRRLVSGEEFKTPKLLADIIKKGRPAPRVPVTIEGEEFRIPAAKVDVTKLTDKGKISKSDDAFHKSVRNVLKTNYGKLTDSGYVVDEDRLKEFNRAVGNIEEFRLQGHSSSNAALLAMAKARDPKGTQGPLVQALMDFINKRSEGVDTAGVPETTPTVSTRTVTRTGSMNGRKVIEYSDGTVEFAD